MNKDDLDKLIPSRVRIAPIWPNQHVTTEQLAQLHVALEKRGVGSERYRIEAIVIYDKEDEKAVSEATYDLGDLWPPKTTDTLGSSQK